MTRFSAQIEIGENETTEYKYAFGEGTENIWTSKVAMYKKTVHFVVRVGKVEEME